HGPP
ncbi:hypothetical protein CFC21_084772, partial [Triticum aestivum]